MGASTGSVISDALRDFLGAAEWAADCAPNVKPPMATLATVVRVAGAASSGLVSLLLPKENPANAGTGADAGLGAASLEGWEAKENPLNGLDS